MNRACVEELLRLAEGRARSGGEAYSMAVSAYEIYNEQIAARDGSRSFEDKAEAASEALQK